MKLGNLLDFFVLHLLQFHCKLPYSKAVKIKGSNKYSKHVEDNSIRHSFGHKQY